MKPNKTVRVLFQRIGQSKDKRFTRVKLWLMHLEDNFNGSTFTKPVVEKAIPSLSNIPILGFLKKTSDGSTDFAGHEIELVINSDGDVEEQYQGFALGTIPETNNAQFEYRLCDDGVEREFLTVEGIVWEKFSHLTKPLLQDGIRPHSMELAENYTGKFNDKNFYEFESFQFEGACILGVDVEPAMINSTIEVQKEFSKSVNTQISEMLKEYQKSIEPEPDIVSDDELNTFFSQLSNLTSSVNGSADSIDSIFSALTNSIKTLSGGNKQ